MKDEQITGRYIQLLDAVVKRYQEKTFTFDYTRAPTDADPHQTLVRRVGFQLEFVDPLNLKTRYDLNDFLEWMVPAQTSPPATPQTYQKHDPHSGGYDFADNELRERL